MKTAREVIADVITKTEATWNVYPSPDSILSALKEAGMVVVPVEPTNLMISEGSNAAFRVLMFEGPDGPHPEEDCFDVRAQYTWKAMIEAAQVDEDKLYPV